MNLIFIDRERETGFLEKKYKENGFQFVVVYGRRRTGKTELIQQFMKDKGGIYYLADKRGTLTNAKLFARQASEYFKDVEPEANNFDDVFKYILKRTGKKKTIVAIDEFSYLIEKDDSLASVFQKIADTILKNSNIFLILSGSSISMMEKGVLSYKSPLYGRRTGEWKLNPLKYKNSLEFFPKYKPEDKVKSALILGGIPAYLKNFDDSQTVADNIKNNLLTRGEPLYREVITILQEELRDPSTYLRILDSMSKGATKIVEIANKSYIEAKDLPKYLDVLQNLEYVGKFHPVTEKPKTKKTIYKITDNFFNFWFRFVETHRSDLEAGKVDEVAAKIEPLLDGFLGKVFEGFCREFLPKLVEMEFTKTGTWWGHYKERGKRKEVEIDLVGLNEKTKQILFCECKWSSLTEKQARKVLEDLKEKSKFVEWERKKEYFSLFAKKIKGKDFLRKEGWFVWDLGDF